MQLKSYNYLFHIGLNKASCSYLLIKIAVIPIIHTMGEKQQKRQIKKKKSLFGDHIYHKSYYFLSHLTST